eukprot:4822032-Prymnesium_polylepis.4
MPGGSGGIPGIGGGGGGAGGGGGSGTTTCSALWRAESTMATIDACAHAVRIDSNHPRRERVRRKAWTLVTTITSPGA